MKAVPAFLAMGTAFLASVTSASVIPFGEVMKQENNVKRESCENTGTSRDCWGDYSIDTNWYVNSSFWSNSWKLIKALGTTSLLTLE